MSAFVKDKNFYRQFFVLTLTIALQNVIVYSVNLADNIMLGKFAEDAMAGVALVNQVQFFLQSMIMGLAEASLMFASRSWGEKDIPSIRKIANISVKCGLVISLALFAIAFFIPDILLGLLSSDAAEVAEGVGYMNIICYTYPMFAVTQLLIYVLRSVETVRIGLVTSIVTLIVNVCLNYVFIFGNFGFAPMGARGAAIATLISRAIELIIVVVYVFFLDKKVKLRIKHFGRIDGKLFRDYLRKGTPVFLSGTMWGFAQGVQTGILGHTAGPTIKANSISSVVFQMVSVVSYASASATSVVIGKAIGEGKKELVKPYAKTLQLLFLMIGAFTGAVLFLLKGPIINFYNISDEAKIVADQFMTVLSVTVIGTSYQMPCHTGIIRAGGDTSFVLKVDTVFMWLITIPAAAVASFVFGAPPVIVFICLKCDQVLKCCVASIKVNSFNYIRSLKSENKNEILEQEKKA